MRHVAEPESGSLGRDGASPPVCEMADGLMTQGTPIGAASYSAVTSARSTEGCVGYCRPPELPSWVLSQST